MKNFKCWFLFWSLECLLSLALVAASERAVNTSYAELHVMDAETNRGVPLVELETTNHLRFVTDNAGRVAFQEPGLMGREVYFSLRSHGYELAKDGFGFAGVKVVPCAGEVAEIKITRKIIAERLCRLTGEGLYRDSLLLGHKSPLAESPNPGRVAGQDSVQATIYQRKVFWLWGDTSSLEYPLGLFRVAGATTSIPAADDPASNPEHGIPFNYFVNEKTRFTRAMMPLAERPEGIVWIFAIFTVPDDEGNERLVGHYSRRKGLDEAYEHGIAIFDDEKQIFTVAKQLPLTEKWRMPAGHPIAWEDEGKKWLLFGSPNPNVRVPATLSAVLDPAQYEALADVGEEPRRQWQKKLPPVDSKTEHELLRTGKLTVENARFCPVDAANAKQRIVLHNGSVRWNRHREAWVLIAGQLEGTSSFLGEVWYAEAQHPTGPFRKAVKVVSHHKQSFYNVCHHEFLDRDGGRTIHFEGTYTNEFSGSLEKTSRYNYNQILYRLDLDDARLRAAHVN